MIHQFLFIIEDKLADLIESCSYVDIKETFIIVSEIINNGAKDLVSYTVL